MVLKGVVEAMKFLDLISKLCHETFVQENIKNIKSSTFYLNDYM